MLSSGLRDSEEASKMTIKPDFYIQNVIDAFYDKKQTPILSEKKVFNHQTNSNPII